MSILVTGGAGYIGSHVALELLAQGRRVIILDNFSTGSHAQVPSGTVLIEGDVRDAGLVANVLRTYKVEAIMHLAGLLVVSESVIDPLRYYHNNVIGALTLVEEAVRADVPHFIFSSSASVYGNPTSAIVSEDAAIQPTHPYGTSKALVEGVLRDTARAHGLRYVALRYFNVAGADPEARSGYGLHKNPTHLVPTAVQAAVGKLQRFNLYGTDYDTPDGTCIRDYLHVSDLARAHVDALLYLINGGIPVSLNCGYGKGFSVKQVIDAVRKKTGKNFIVDILPRRAGDPPMLVADASRIQKELGWTHRYNNLDLIIEHELKWLQRQPYTNFSLASKIS